MTTVLQIIPSLNSGGAEQACIDVVAGLRAAGHRAIVVSSGGFKTREIGDLGGTHITRPVNSKNPATIIANAMWLKGVMRQYKVDIVHARSRAPAWTAWMATRGTHCGFVTTFHAAYKFSNPAKKLYNSIMTRADRVIAISEFIATHLRENYHIAADKLRVIPRGIDLDKFDNTKAMDARQERLRKMWGVDASQTVIFLPARLSPIKGQKIFIDALALLPLALRNLVAIIAGDDQGRREYRSMLNQTILEDELSDSVKVVPPCDDMPAAYGLASLVIAPSLVPEGFGRTPVEAMSMGVPVIASDLGGYRETIRPGITGWLVPPADPQKLADAVLHALGQTPEQRKAMTQTPMHQTRSRYDKRKMVADTLKVYEDILKY